MIFKRTPVATAVSVSLLLSISLQARAQEEKPSAALETVTVTGIRASTEKALSMKREASANVDVITAVDVGKMPDKNLADSLQRVVGVAVRTDYDEAEKVSMRGTNPDMTLILFNGHSVSGGDWYLADQASSSRSTSLSLMPSSVLNAATVYKTSQADIVDGGLAGTVNVTTRRPLKEAKKFGGLLSVGGVYADLPAKTSPQLNGSVNWKNESNTFGVIGQLFAEKRYVRRDSVSRAAYSSSSGWDVIDTAAMKGITDASLAGTGYKASDLQGVRLPGSMALEYVEGVRDRKGGMLALEAQPTDRLNLGLTGFYSRMNANNFGRATYSAIQQMLRGQSYSVQQGTLTNTNVYAQIKNPVIVDETTIYGDHLKVLKSADIVFPDGSAPQYLGNSEGYYRSGARSSSGFLDLDATMEFSDRLKVKGLISTTRGVGHTEADRGLTYDRYGQGVSYALNGVNVAPDFHYINAGNPSSPTLDANGAGYKLDARSGVNSYNTVDAEHSVALDGEFRQDSGPFSTLQFGLRQADHSREFRRAIKAFKSGTFSGPDPSLAVAYPGNFGQALGGNFESAGFYFPKEVLTDYFNSQVKDVGSAYERFVSSEIDVRERQRAVYMMQNFETADNRISGNIGFRLVRTEVDSLIPTPVSTKICPRIEPGQPATACPGYPGVINTAGDAQPYYDGVPFNPATGSVYYKKATHKNFDNILPSFNLRMEVAKDVIGRVGLSETIGRQNYNLYGATFGTPTCDGSGNCSVTGPNPDLKPLTARNLDLSVAWFFARRSMVSVSLFDSLIDGYAKTGAIKQGVTVDLIDPTTGATKTYFVNTSTQQKARIRGVELAYEQPIGGGFGFQSNASVAETRVADGRPMTGASKFSANLGGYFENDIFSVRLVYNYRGKYVSSTTAPSPTTNSQGNTTINGVVMPVAPTMAAPVSNVALSANYNITPDLQIAFSATNLTNPTRAQYRYSEEEQQKLDASGRQYYLEARYKF
ncbi:TonB-dependent receptor [Paucibacter sp. R3-3]|uniref:TonB-dependent receptor n=1 Tax=Roseateles agri TaxID=3098619 RepID=A0ABU5DFE4_9BURK|nr:TonB-dependent receptor [Paucibacter sp. R3-3]MDY0744849.1 TonB-dependent receptor [Paucibacter sp. R3-3]